METMNLEGYMSSLLLKMGSALLMKLFTEAFVARFVIRVLRSLAAMTSNKLDDGLVNELADALGCADLKV